MAPKLSGKVNGNLSEALESVLGGSRIDWGLIRVVSAERSGVIGVCREYLTGAQINGSDMVGMDALHALCRMPRGIWTIHPTCEVADFVAVNQELHIPIKEMLEELKKPAPPPQPVVQKKPEPAPAPQPEPVAAPPPAVPEPVQPQQTMQDYWEPAQGADPQTISAAQRVMPPLGALTGGTASVPPPPPPGGMLNRVKTAIGNAMSGRYRAVQTPEENPLVYDPTAINKDKNILNSVLGRARQTLTKLRPVKARQEELAQQQQMQQQQMQQQQMQQQQMQQQQMQQQQMQQQAPPAPPYQQAPMPQQPQPIQPMQPYRQGPTPPNQAPPQPYQPTPNPPQEGPMQPYRNPNMQQNSDGQYVHPAFERHVPQAPPPHIAQTPHNDEEYPEAEISQRTQRVMEPTSVSDVPIIRDDGTVTGVNALFHQQVRKKSNTAGSGRNKSTQQMRAAAAQAADDDLHEEQRPGFWAKLFGKK
jgi:TolA-binding protein